MDGSENGRRSFPGPAAHAPISYSISVLTAADETTTPLYGGCPVCLPAVAVPLPPTGSMADRPNDQEGPGQTVKMQLD
jgi:hypothetical protein